MYQSLVGISMYSMCQSMAEGHLTDHGGSSSQGGFSPVIEVVCWVHAPLGCVEAGVGIKPSRDDDETVRVHSPHVAGYDQLLSDLPAHRHSTHTSLTRSLTNSSQTNG